MKRVMIHQERCENCGPCRIEEVCRYNAVFRDEPGEKPWIDFYRCAGCLKCKTVCPNGAIEIISKPCDSKQRMGW